MFILLFSNIINLKCILEYYNMRDIVLLNCPEIECPNVLIYVFIELCQAFIERNYNFKIIQNINEITNNCLVFMGDTIKNPNIVSILNNIAPEAVYIGWYWHQINASALKYFIYTYENMLNPDNRVKFFKMKVNNCPLLLRAPENPELVGTYKKNILYDYCYMGWKYKPEFVPSKAHFKGIYHGVTDHKFFLHHSMRKEIYLSSIFALGFQSDKNISDKHVSQRIFEGLAYGCIVLSNSIPACEQTNNIVIYINSKEDLENKMRFFKAKPELIKQKQLEGYEFIKKYGTNHYAIDNFINCIKNTFDIEI